MRIRFVCYMMMSLVVGGCLRNTTFIPIRYYSVDTLSSPVSPATRSWPIALGVQPFTAPTRYRDRMLYRRSDVEIGFYEYDRWVEPPEEMVTRVVISMVRASGLFRQVVSANNVQLPAWILNGEVVRFDEVREGGSRRAECWVRVELHRASDDHLLWAKSFRAAVPLVMKTPQAFAQAMSHAVQHVALQLIASLEEANPPHLQEKQH